MVDEPSLPAENASSTSPNSFLCILKSSLPIFDNVAPSMASTNAYSVNLSRAGAQLTAGAPSPSLASVRRSTSSACSPSDA
ncbi:hypothetical protein G6F65_021708 [Rhizopus arrhizus]|nr:hypothetical protein G6F65_021708 [Rhizopus arrhizus]